MRKEDKRFKQDVSMALEVGSTDRLIELAIRDSSKMIEYRQKLLDEYNEKDQSDSLYKITYIGRALSKADEYQKDPTQKKMSRGQIVLKKIQENVGKMEQKGQNNASKDMIMSKILKLQYEQDEECSEYALQLAKKYNIQEVIENDENTENVMNAREILKIYSPNVSYEKFSKLRKKAIDKVVFNERVDIILEEHKNNPDFNPEHLTNFREENLEIMRQVANENVEIINNCTNMYSEKAMNAYEKINQLKRLEMYFNLFNKQNDNSNIVNKVSIGIQMPKENCTSIDNEEER
jgi:hypothetical protein